MTPHRLVVQAFGPFAETEVVDFRLLEQRSLFLIHGPTGAGKSSLLDAMSFALFGLPADTERDPRGLRSDHADADCRTEVTLDLALGEKKYRVWRAPWQMRPKRSGDGETEASPKATLWDRSLCFNDDDEGHVLTEGVMNVTREIERIVGFAHAHFRQVVVLPQGRFRDLLCATSKERQKILDTLFQTERFRRIEDALATRAKQLAGEEAELRQRQLMLLENAPGDAATIEELGAAVEACKEQLAVATKAAETAEKARAEATRAVEEARAVRRRLTERDKAARRVDRLSARGEEMDARRELLRRARAAEPLRRAHEDVRTLRAATTAVEKAAARHESARADHAGLEGARERVREQIDAATASADRIEGVREALGHAETAVARADELRASVARLAESEKSLRRATRGRELAEKALGAARRELDGWETLWVKGQAGLLARTLEAGEPCPVCGAEEHPAPADVTDLVDDARLDAEREAVRSHERHLEGARADQDALAKEHAERTGHVRALEEMRKEGSPEREELERRRDSLSEELARCERHAKSLVGAKKMARGLEKKIAAAVRAIEEAAQLVAARRDELARAETTLRERLVGIDPGLAVDGTLTPDVAEACLETALRDAGFETADEVATALLSGGERDGLEAKIDAWELELRVAREKLVEAEAAAEGLEPPKLKTLERRLTTAARNERTARERQGAMRERTKLVARAHREAVRLEKRLEDTSGRHGVAGRLAAVASGQNEPRISFQRFVLAALLDDVLAVAGERLQRLSRGRFRLQRALEGRARRTAGLDLEVHDEWTGTARPAATLSGGESFLASLALALGLADVVRQYAGGVRLDTIFIDEGFGSLDAEALELAWRTLADLQAEGRHVGIISHVGELRELVHDRLEVIPDRGGSRVRFHVA